MRRPSCLLLQPIRWAWRCLPARVCRRLCHWAISAFCARSAAAVWAWFTRPNNCRWGGASPSRCCRLQHWYEFLFDGSTGAELINEDADPGIERIRLHLVDGQRGDFSRDGLDGFILDPGGPAVRLAEAPRQLGTIGDQSLSIHHDRLDLDILAPDASGNLLPLAQEAGTLGRVLDQLFGLTFRDSLYEDWGDLGERWVWGEDDWYFVMPDGGFHRWDGNPTASGERLADLEPVFYHRPDLLYDAAPGDQAYVLDQALGLRHTGNLWQDWGGQDERWLQGADGQWYFLKPHGSFFAWDGSDSARGTYLAAFDPLYHEQLERLYDAQPEQFTVSLSGGALGIDPAPRFVGSFHVGLTAADRTIRTREILRVEVTHKPPMVADIGDPIVFGDQEGLAFAPGIAATEFIAMTHSARAGTPAYLLDQEHDLRFSGSFHEGYGGSPARWLQGEGGWYFVLPDGQLFLRNGRENQSTGTHLATLDPVFYHRPDLLFDARPGDLAHVLDQALGLKHVGDLRQDWDGQGERWLQGSGGQWYFLKPTGELFAWDGTASATGTFLARFSSIYHEQIERLHQAQPDRFMVGLQDEMIDIGVAQGFIGHFDVSLMVTDGVSSSARRFRVTRWPTPTP